ncbi:hypothetical protein EJB05_12135, partial [Eragrostis curvula]
MGDGHLKLPVTKFMLQEFMSICSAAAGSGLPHSGSVSRESALFFFGERVGKEERGLRSSNARLALIRTKLNFGSEGHLRGDGQWLSPLPFHIYKVTGNIKARYLLLGLVDNIVPPCDANCDCRTLQTWEDRRIGLDHLKIFAMKNFSGTPDETYVIRQIVENAKVLRKVSLVFSVGANPTEEFLYNLHTLAPSSCIVRNALFLKLIYLSALRNLVDE